MNLRDPRYLFLLIVPLWFVLAFLTAQISGWRQLLRYYRARNPFDGMRWSSRSAQMRFSSYKNLTVGANMQGLYLAVSFLLRPGHPPLFVSWEDISVKRGKILIRKILWLRWTEFRFRQAPHVRVKIFGDVGEEIESVAGSSWPGEKAFV